ncbi:hypothetical protein BKA63DRAFT_485857 [Paraphoma chrysanthemicola]|nr:hypothetical protein BKA63DRAFT_485857 [Paraphoma chrysanthemicola]
MTQSRNRSSHQFALCICFALRPESGWGEVVEHVPASFDFERWAVALAVMATRKFRAPHTATSRNTNHPAAPVIGSLIFSGRDDIQSIIGFLSTTSDCPASSASQPRG